MKLVLIIQTDHRDVIRKYASSRKSVTVVTLSMINLPGNQVFKKKLLLLDSPIFEVGILNIHLTCLKYYKYIQ